jgi:amino acid transporter
LRDAHPMDMLGLPYRASSPKQGAVMWFWLAGGIVFTLVVLVLLRLSTSKPDLGAVSDGWLARNKADRRSSDF